MRLRGRRVGACAHPFFGMFEEVRATQIIVAATLMLAIAGCGNSADRLSAANAGTLHREVASIRAAAAAGNRSGALTALTEFTQSVGRYARAAQISPGELIVLARGIQQTRQRILSEIKAPAATQAPAPATTPTPAPPDHGHGKKDHGQGGNGGAGGNGGD
jgi:hypothetical protein